MIKPEYVYQEECVSQWPLATVHPDILSVQCEHPVREKTELIHHAANNQQIRKQKL